MFKSLWQTARMVTELWPAFACCSAKCQKRLSLTWHVFKRRQTASFPRVLEMPVQAVTMMDASDICTRNQRCCCKQELDQAAVDLSEVCIVACHFKSPLTLLLFQTYSGREETHSDVSTEYYPAGSFQHVFKMQPHKWQGCCKSTCCANNRSTRIGWGHSFTYWP
jgi:hypothetical protein